MNNKSLENIISNYLQDLTVEKRCSKHTIISYKNDLNQFYNFCISIDKKNINELNEKIVKRFLYHLNEMKFEKSSISRKLTVIRGIFNYAFSKELIENNLVQLLKNPKAIRKLPEIITENDYPKILEEIDKDKSIMRLYSIELVKVIFELLYGCSLRVSEVCNIKYGDLYLKEKTIKILGKGSKARIVPIGDKSLEFINEYLKQKQFTSSNQFLLSNNNGKEIYPRLVQRLVKKYFSRVTDIKKRSPHILRHSSATHMLNNDANLLAIKEILGHSNLSTTQIYTQVSIEKLKKVYNNSHPKS